MFKNIESLPHGRARFAETLLALDDRDDLSPEEEALAES
jgi:hypothetical protein